MLNILADENIPAVEHYLDGLGRVTRCDGREIDSAQLVGVDALLVRSVTRVDEALLAASSVKFVGSATSGLDHVDREYLREASIGFAYAPGSNANSVVEYVLAAIAASAASLERLLEGGRVGIIGYGVIGKALAARLRALNISYRAYDPWLDQRDIDHAASLPGVLDCEVVTLHAELTREQPWPSYHLLDDSILGQLDKEALLINASRGAVVDNHALLALLSAGGGPQTILDVWEGEPAIDHALLERVKLATPHIAGYSLDGKLLATRMLAEALASQFGRDWDAPASPAGEAEPLAVPATVQGAGLVRYLLGARYDISSDDAALRAVTLGQDCDSAARAFDRLRRDYPERRELLGSTVHKALFTPQDRELITALGCKPSDEGSVA